MHRNLWLSAVALSSPELPDVEELAGALEELSGGRVTVSTVEQHGNLLTLRIGPAVAALTLVPGPIPWEHLEGPIVTAWHWPDAAEELERHTAHLLITLMDEGRDPIDKAILLTRLTAAVVESGPVCGIFWGPGRQVHAPQAFLEESRAMSRDDLPLYLWVDFRVETQPDGRLRVFTTGMEPLGRPELEARDFAGTPQGLRENVYNVAHFLLEQPTPPKDGETIGTNDGPQMTMRHAPSLVDGETEVVELQFE